MPTPGGTCRFCAEALPEGATEKCPWCGEAQGRVAQLIWERGAVIVRTPGELPIGVCFGCAAVGATRTRRLFGPRKASIQHVDVPLCAACLRRAEAVPMLGAAIAVVAILAGSCLFPVLLSTRVAPVLIGATGAFVLLVVFGLALTAYHNARTRVGARWRDGIPRLRLPDAHVVRRAVETHGT